MSKNVGHSRLVVAVMACVASAAYATDACYQLSSLGMGCSWADPPVSPECLYDTTINNSVDICLSVTPPGRTGCGTTYKVVCKQKIGRLNEFNECVWWPEWYQETEALDATLSGAICPGTP